MVVILRMTMHSYLVRPFCRWPNGYILKILLSNSKIKIVADVIILPAYVSEQVGRN